MSLKRKSKYLSLILRHKPESIGLILDSKGYGSVDYICDYLDMSMEDLDVIVQTNNKKRFKFNIFLAVFGLPHEEMIYKRGPMV